MAEDNKEPVAAEGEKWFHLSLHEVTYSFGVPEETIIEIIDEGIIPAQKNENDEWIFDNEAIRRIRTVLQLNRDLGINLAGAGLALELLNEIEHLHSLLDQRKS